MNKKIIIVGRGAVGNAIYQSIPKDIAYVEQYHSKNIKDAYGSCPDLLIYAGVPGVKWKAEEDPIKDRQAIRDAFINIQEIKPEKCILISSIDAGLSATDEGFSLYGLHRRGLENAVLNALGANATVVRLPALAGDTVYKNIWYDILHPFPNKIIKKSQIEWINHLVSKLKDGAFHIGEDLEGLHYEPSTRAWNQANLGWFLATHPQSKMLWLNINDLGQQLLELVDNDDIWNKTILLASLLNGEKPALLSTQELYQQMKNQTLPVLYQAHKMDQPLTLDDCYKDLYYVDYSDQLHQNIVFINNIYFHKDGSLDE